MIYTEINNFKLPDSFDLNQYELKKNYKFIVELDIFGVESWKVQKITLPKYIDFMWQDIKIDLIDTNTSSTTSQLYNFIKNNKLKELNFNIKYVDGTGKEISMWTILFKNFSIDFGILDYGNDKLLMPSITIEPLDCILKY